MLAGQALIAASAGLAALNGRTVEALALAGLFAAIGTVNVVILTRNRNNLREDNRHD